MRDFLVTAFEHAGLDWEKHVRFDERYLRPTEVDALVGDATQGRAGPGLEGAGATPSELARIMVDADIEALKHEGRPWIDQPEPRRLAEAEPAASMTDGVPPGAARPRRHRSTSPGTAAWSGRRSGAALEADGVHRPHRRDVGRARPARTATAVFDFFAETKPTYVVLAAAKVGGILANSTYPVDFLSDNLRIQVNVMDAALRARRRAAAVPRLVVHLPQARAAADPRGLAAHRPPRADQRRLRDRQDRRHPAGAGGPPPVRPAVDLGDADQPLRPGRQLLADRRSHVLPALIRRYDEAVGRGLDERHQLGHRHPAPRVPARRRHGRRLPAPAGALRRPAAGQRRHRARTPRSGRSPRSSPRSSASRARPAGTPRKPDGTPQKLLDVSKLASAGWTSRIGLREGVGVDGRRGTASTSGDLRE